MRSEKNLNKRLQHIRELAWQRAETRARGENLSKINNMMNQCCERFLKVLPKSRPELEA